MKTLILAAIRCSLMFTAVSASLFSVRPVQAYTIILEEVASDIPNGVPAKVVANGCGAINLTGLSQLAGSHSGDAHIKANEGEIVMGPNGTSFDLYNANTGPHPITGPHDFGGGLSSLTADAGSGDFVGIHFLPNGELVVPLHYVSGNALRSSATWNNKTFATLGVTPGTYVWTWGTGADQRFTLIVGGHVLPLWWYCMARIWKVIFVVVLVGFVLLLWAALWPKSARRVKSSSV